MKKIVTKGLSKLGNITLAAGIMFIAVKLTVSMVFGSLKKDRKFDERS